MATSKRKAFTAELTAALSKQSPGYSTSSSTQYSQASGQTVIYIAIRDYNPEGVEKEDGLRLKKGEQVVLIQSSPDPESKRAKLDDELRSEIGGSLLDNSAAKHKLSVKPPKNHPKSRDTSPGPGTAEGDNLGTAHRLLVQSLDTDETGWVPSSLLEKQQVQHYESEMMETETEVVMETSAGGVTQAKYCREAIVRELVDTEEEYGRDLQTVVDRYLKPLDSPSVPRVVRDNKDVVFSNLKQITEFHKTVLIEGVKYYADEPRMLGKTFLRLERDFDKHVQYCKDEPVAQDFLQENAEAREYFEERAQSLGDERSLSEHLKLPIQRIHDYQLLLKDLVKYSRKLGEDVTDLNKALELMLAIPHKASDNKFISNIEGYHGNIHKLGRLLRHDWFKVTFADSPKEKERYLFLFKARILICKVKKVAEDRSVFVLKHIIRLPEVEIKDDSNSQLKFSLTNKFKEFTEYPIQLVAHKPNSKSEWLSEIRQYAADILALAEHAADDLRVQQETSSSDSKFGSLKGVELEISDDISTEDIEQFTGPPIIEEQKRIKSQLKHVEPPERPPISLGDIPKKKAIFRFSDEDELIADEIQVVAPDVEARIESGELIVQEVSSRSATSTRSTVTVEQTGSIGETRQVLQEISPNLVQPSEDKVSRSKSPNLVPPSEDKVSRSKSPSKEQQETVPTTEETQGQEEGEGDMSRYGSSGSRYRSVSSKVSEEVFVSSSGGIGGNNSSSSSRSFALVEESINGKTVRRDVMTSGSDSIGDAGSLLDRAGVKSYARTDSVGSGCAIEEISSVRHLDGKTYDNNNEEMVAGGRTARRGQVEDYGEQITSSSSTVRKSSKYSSSSTLDGGDTDLSSVRSKNTSSLVSSSILEDDAGSVSSRTKRPILDEEDSESSRRTKRVQDEDVMISSRTSQQYARQESSSTKRSLLDEEDDSSTLQNRTKKSAISALDEEETVSSSRRTKTEKSVGVSVEKESYSASVTSRASEEAGAGPEFIKPLESYSCKVGDDVTLECDVAADVLWLKNNRPIPLSFGDRYYPSSSEDNLHHKLQIMGVKESDEDSFTVRATNEEGHASYCTTRLTVEHDHQQDAVDGSPRFLIALRNTTVLDKTFLRFMVKVSGSPKPEVKFYKNDRFITPSNTRVKVEKARSSQGYYELILPQVREEDEGVYKCVAMNEHGEAESEATLSVTDDKTIFYGLEGSDLLKSGETPQFQWLRDGQPFQPEDRFKVDYKDEGDSLQLVFQNVKPEDAGLYTCVGTTSTGRLACSAELTIQGSVNQLAREPAAPKMSAESKTFESSLGSTAMMEFTCEGYPKPYLKIEKDGKDVEIGNKTKFMYESEEQVILAIKNLEPEDAGKYTVEAMNELGTAAQEFHLNIKALPKIKHAPPKFKNKLGDGEDVNIMVGQELKLAVGVEGIPKPDVKWLKDGKAVKETKDLAISYDDSGVHYLTIEKANLKDSGTYSVTATNEQSTITDFTRVTVHAPPVFLRTMTKTTDCNVGDTITYQIKVEGDPLPEVKWMKDGVPLQIDEQHLKVTADGQVHSLIVNKVKREDTGKYSALISNEHGSSQDDGRMNVRCAPLFTQKLEDFSALEGDQDVEFVVDIECYPRPVVKWFHDKTEITEKLSEFTRIEQTDGNTYKLVLKQVEREHAGKYICEVSNNLGKLKCEANFVVKAKPRFKKTLPETVEIDEGQSLTLSIDVEAVPEPEVKWYRNGQEISADANIKITRDTKRIENYNLTVTLVRPENGGEYEVRASNEVGNAVTKSRVLVHSVTKTKEQVEEEEGEEENTTKRKSDRLRKKDIFGYSENGSEEENDEVKRKKSILNDVNDDEDTDGEVFVTSRSKTVSKRKVTVTQDGVEKVVEDVSVENVYENDDGLPEKRRLNGPTVEEIEDENVWSGRRYSRQDSKKSTEKSKNVPVNEEQVDVEMKVKRHSRQNSEVQEDRLKIENEELEDDVKSLKDKANKDGSSGKPKRRKWSITNAQVESYDNIAEENGNLDDEIYETSLGEKLRRKFTKKDEDDNLRLTIYEITDAPTGEKSQKVKVSKDDNLQHPRIDIYETKKPKISYSSSIDELDDTDEEEEDTTKLTRDGSNKDIDKNKLTKDGSGTIGKKKSYSRSVSKEEMASRKTSRQSSTRSRQSSSSDDEKGGKLSRQTSENDMKPRRASRQSSKNEDGVDGERISRKTSRQTSKNEDEEEIVSRKTSRQSSKIEEKRKISENEDGKDEVEEERVSRKTSRQTSRIEEKRKISETEGIDKDGDKEEEIVSRKTSRQTSRIEERRKISENEEDNFKTDEDIDQLLERSKEIRKKSATIEEKKIEEPSETEDKPIEEMSVIERIRRKYSKTTPEDDGDELDLERYRPSSRLEDKYQRLVSKNQDFIEETVGSRRPSKVEDMNQPSRASRQSSILEDTPTSRRASKIEDVSDSSYPRRASKIEDVDDTEEILSNIRSRRTSRLKEEDLDQPARGKLDKQSSVIEETTLTSRRSSKVDDLTQQPSKGQLDEDDSTTVETSSRRTSYSRRSTSKDESLETINPEDGTEGKAPPANKLGATDLRRRSSKLENIPDDEVLEVKSSFKSTKSVRAEVTTTDMDGTVSRKSSMRAESSFSDADGTAEVVTRKSSRVAFVDLEEDVTQQPSRGKLDKDAGIEGEEQLPSEGASRRTSKSSSVDVNVQEKPKNLSRQTSKNDETPKNLSRQSSKVESVEEASQKGKVSRLSSRTSTAELSQQTSEVKDVEGKSKSAEKAEIEDLEESQKSRASRLNSWTSVDDLSESNTTTPKNHSRQTSMSRETSVVKSFEETAKLSRRSSKVESVEEIATMSRRSSQISIAAESVDTPKNLSRQASKVESVGIEQESKLSRKSSLSRSSTVDESDDTPKNLSQQTTPKNLTRQNSTMETIEENGQQPKVSRANSQSSDTPRNLTRQNSTMEPIDEAKQAGNLVGKETEEPKNFSRQESKLSRQGSTTESAVDQKPKNLSRQSSILKNASEDAKNASESKVTEEESSVPKNFSKSRQNSVVEDKKLPASKGVSRQSSKADDDKSSGPPSRKGSRKSTKTPDGETSLSRKSSKKSTKADLEEDVSDKGKSKKASRQNSSQLAETEVPAQIIEERMDARKVFETLSTVFEVLAIGYPAPEATWFKDGVPLEESDRLLITNEGKSYKIEIVRTTHSDAGEYSVVIKNRLGEATSKGSLEIDDVQGLRSPRIKTPLESLIIHKYEKAQFTAAVITFPEPDIKWTIAGKDPQPVVEYIVDTKELDYGLLECTFTLFIPNGHHCHTGDVLFVASNEYGSCETGARLDVLLRPEIQALKDLTCEPYQTTQFEVEIDANPKPRVTWSFKGEKLCGTDPRVQITSDPDKDMYRVTIRNVGLGDEGVYEVEASNNLGVASALARLKVHRPDKTLAGDEDLEPSDLQTAKRVGDRDRNKPQAGDLDKTGGLTNGDIGEDEMLDSKRHKPGTLDCEDGRKPRRARFDIDDEDNDFDSEGNKPGSLDSKDGSKPRRGKFNVDEEGDTDSKHNEPGTLDSDTSGKPRRGKYGIDDSDEHGSKGKEPGSLDSKDGSKPRRDKFYVDDGGILNYMELARCYNFTNKVVFSTTWNSQDVVVTSQTWRYSQLHDSQDIVTSLPMMLLYLHKRFSELISRNFHINFSSRTKIRNVCVIL
uniref:Muscle M-line assembly protein unc-89 n=1 Tax=Cacopsylla melanoneura TaxID=428564 RepID=A0A8D8TG74_9HEMI